MTDDTPRPRRALPVEPDDDAYVEPHVEPHVEPAPGAAAPEPPASQSLSLPSSSGTPDQSESVATSSAADPGDHSLFLPPTAEGSVSHTWVHRTLHVAADDATDASGTSAGVAEGRQPLPEASDAPTAAGGSTAVASTPSLLRRILPWLVAGLVLAVVVGAIVLRTTRKPVVTVTATVTASTAASSARVAVSPDDLLTERSAGRIATTPANASWTIAQTSTSVTSSSPLIACQPATASGQPVPTATLQRTLTSTAQGNTAVLHQIDGYASVDDARSALAARRHNLGVCDASPLYIADGGQVSGLGDETAAVVVADQQQVTTFHTVLLVRTGSVIDSYDVAQAGTAVSLASVAETATTAVTGQCHAAGGSCSADPLVTASAPPAGSTTGFLGTADLPRLTPSTGVWTATDPASITANATPCDAVSLSSVADSTSRTRRSYLLTEDPDAPATFGVDEYRFVFRTPAKASAFTAALARGIATCAQRTPTVKVVAGSMTTVPTAGASGSSTPGSSASPSVTAPSVPAPSVPDAADPSGVANYLLSADTADQKAVLYRVAVVTSGTQVDYLVNTPTAAFGFTPDAWSRLAVRAQQRAAQAR